MTTIFNFQTKSGKQQGILAVYILHTLHKKPKSGYDLLKEITEKTHGAWTPSKGTLYPLLNKLEEDGFIEITQVEQRSKTIYETTKKGMDHLTNIRKHATEMEEKINQFRNMLSEIIDEEKSEIINTMLQIRKLIFQLPQTKHDEIQEILYNTLSQLQKLAKKEGLPDE
jgi:DNA-binding PadR family transcriptional regulator